MFKQLVTNMKHKNMSLFKNYDQLYPSYCAPRKFLAEVKSPRANLKVSNDFHTTSRTSSDMKTSKLFATHENSFAFNVITKHNLNKLQYKVSEEVFTLQAFNNLLDRNWRECAAEDIMNAFENVRKYCIVNNIPLSDMRFNKLVDGLMDNCEKLSDENLISLLGCISEYPLCENFDAHNFHDIWSCLDDICCWKMVNWDIDKCFIVANIWYKMNLGKLCDFIFILIDRLSKKAENLSKDQLVNVLFYFNVCRRRAVDFEYEYAIEKQIRNMNVDEMAIVSMGYFKTKTRIKILGIIEAMVQKVTEDSKDIHEIALTAILKVVRYSKPTKLVKEIHEMLDRLSFEVERLSNLCCLHIMLMNTGLQVIHKNSLQKSCEKLILDITNEDKIRLKDIERILNVLSMFNYDPKTNPDIFQASYLELHKQSRLAELSAYPRCLVCALNYLSLCNIYSYELMDRILDVDHIEQTYGKSSKMLPRELLSLDCSITIECPEYNGNRLPPRLKYKGAKWLAEYTPSYDQWKKITRSDKLVLDTIDTVKLIVKDSNLFYVGHVLPHFSRSDIIVCKNKETGKFVEPNGFENYVLGDVMFPCEDSSLEWFAIVVVGWNNTVRDSSNLLGNMLMKRRQLEKIGYKPVFVIWNEFMNLPPDLKYRYISEKLK
ncbi:unnamed protein product [Phaedon cochleariae]|uniref:RAP domain-containing protein n=1 Tax=Phaedon cochleariae TaxID=80249 RepID=A0A9N9SCN0_PHACE|nr:unnamed protein product [Phaedon cochleariae]